MSARGPRKPAFIDHTCYGPTLFFPESILPVIERLLCSYGGGEEHEGIVYLGGVETPRGSVALVAIGPQATTTWGSFETHVDANMAVVSTLASLGITLVGQVHSHPGQWVDHSDGDDEGALVRFSGYWSIVVPQFARQGLLPLTRCGIHIYQDGQFRRLSDAAVEARIRVIPCAADLRA